MSAPVCDSKTNNKKDRKKTKAKLPFAIEAKAVAST